MSLQLSGGNDAMVLGVPLASEVDGDYLTALTRLHGALHPRTYLEIGAETGASLALSQARSIAIDPMFQLNVLVTPGKPACLLFQCNSDAFFAHENATALLAGPIDMAFLDGMHWYEFLLRDFINAEKHCRSNSVILLHDCLPPDAYVARRLINDDRLAEMSTFPKSWWAGDVWKLLPILQKYRPDLKIHAFNSSPTGLVAITRLNPDNNVLADNYFNIIAEFAPDGPSEALFATYADDLDVQQGRLLANADFIARLFWMAGPAYPNVLCSLLPQPAQVSRPKRKRRLSRLYKALTANMF